MRKRGVTTKSLCNIRDEVKKSTVCSKRLMLVKRQTSDKFIPIVVDGPSESVLGILDVRVRFTNGMELSQSEGDLNELFGMIRKMLG